MQSFEQKVEFSVIWDTMAIMWHHCNRLCTWALSKLRLCSANQRPGYASITSNRGPRTILSPFDFLPVRPCEAPVGILRRAVLVVTSGYGPRTAWRSCIFMVWLNNSQDSTGTPCDARAGVVRDPHWNLQCFSYPTGPVQDPCVTRKIAVRCPYGHARELTQP